MNIFMLPSVGPFAGVQEDVTKKIVGDRTFRVVLYGAYMPCKSGYMPESNGIAVLDEDRKTTLLDREYCESSGYYGASLRQQKRFKEITEMDDGKFIEFICAHPRYRYSE